MTREEAMEALSVLKIYDNQWLREAVDMAIEALSQPIVCKDYRIDDDHIYCSPKMADRVVEALSEDISEDGTLKVNVSDASKVKRVMVWGEESGGLYYPNEGNVQNMHNGMDIEQAIEWCKDCQHDEVCRYYPYDGCEFKDTSERSRGEWILVCDGGGECDNLYRCSHCGQEVGCEEYDKPKFCGECGSDMRGERGE